MSRKDEINPDQGGLFGPESGPPREFFPSDPPEKLLGDQTIPTTYGEPGTYVNIAQRSKLLISALNNFGLRNQRLAFSYIADTPRHRKSSWGKYGSKTPQVKRGAERKADEFLDQAKIDFWNATGFKELRGKGLGVDEQLDSEAKKMWRDFAAAFEHPSKNDQKNQYTKDLNRNISLAKKIIKHQVERKQ